MLDLEASSVPFFILFNSILIVVGYNFWNHFPREGGKYRNPDYYSNLQRIEPVIEENKVDNSLDLPSTGKLLTSCVQTGLDSRSEG